MKKKGMDIERYITKKLLESGFQAVRVAGSGAGTKAPRPDIIAGNRFKKYAIEVKSSIGDRIYIQNKQIRDLKEFANGFGAVPIVAIKFRYLKHIFLSLSDLDVTSNGNYSITRKKAISFVDMGKSVLS